MINRTKWLFTVMLLFGIYTGCNSPIYEIVEVEEPIEEIKEEVKPPVTEIKEDTKPPENKFSEKNVVSRTYVVQIGAFTDEVNAERYSPPIASLRKQDMGLNRDYLILEQVLKG